MKPGISTKTRPDQLQAGPLGTLAPGDAQEETWPWAELQDIKHPFRVSPKKTWKLPDGIMICRDHYLQLLKIRTSGLWRRCSHPPALPKALEMEGQHQEIAGVEPEDM